MPMIGVAEFAPDQPELATQASAYVRNVLPRTATSYGPVPAHAPVSNALAGPCRGAAGATDSAGNTYAFAGDATKLYRLTGNTWGDVSKVGGYTTGTEAWRFAVFGGRLIATNFNNPMQVFTLGTSSVFSDLSAGAPRARYLAVAKNFLIAGNTYDSVTGNAPQRVWWSAFGDCTNWPTPGSNTALANQSDYQDILGDHGWIQGLVGGLGAAHVAIFFERAVYRMTYSGAPAFFDFSPVEGSRGTPAPGSIAQLGAVAYYLGEDGFYVFDGTSSTPIGAGKVDRFFFGDVDPSRIGSVCAALDPAHKLCLWAYPTSAAGGALDRVLAYNWDIGRWSLIDGVSLEYIYRQYSLGVTLEDLDAYGSLDSLPFSLDDRALTGGKLTLAAFDTNHKLGYFSGPPLAATVDTQEGQLNPPRRSFVRSVRPITDAGSPSVAVGGRNTPQSPVTWGTAVPMTADGACPQRSCYRFHRARIQLPAGTAFQHISGLDLDAVPEGMR